MWIRPGFILLCRAGCWLQSQEGQILPTTVARIFKPITASLSLCIVLLRNCVFVVTSFTVLCCRRSWSTHFANVDDLFHRPCQICCSPPYRVPSLDRLDNARLHRTKERQASPSCLRRLQVVGTANSRIRVFPIKAAHCRSLPPTIVGGT